MAWLSFDGRIVQSGMRVPLRIIAINTERRFVDFKLAGKPSSPAKLVLSRRPAPASRKHDKPKPKPAATTGPPTHRKQIGKLKHRRRK